MTCGQKISHFVLFCFLCLHIDIVCAHVSVCVLNEFVKHLTALWLNYVRHFIIFHGVHIYTRKPNDHHRIQFHFLWNYRNRIDKWLMWFLWIYIGNFKKLLIIEWLIWWSINTKMHKIHYTNELSFAICAYVLSICESARWKSPMVRSKYILKSVLYTYLKVYEAKQGSKS